MRPDRRYWHRNLFVIASLLGVWAFVTFGIAFFGRELSQFAFFGWPFSFWAGAQGTLIVYLTIIIFYARYMNRLDDEYERNRPDEQGDTEPGS